MSNAAYFEKRIPIILELGFNESQLPMLENYIAYLWESNEVLNLISRKMTFEELIDNHLIDCLLPLKYFPKDVKNVADYGTGGGLPGVLYAIQFPEIKFHLYEKSKLKCDFLVNCKAFAPNLIVQGDITSDIKNVDLIIARAFKPIDVHIDMSRSYYLGKGKYFLLKARREKIDEEMALARKRFKDIKAEIISLKSPVLDVERHLVLI